MLGTPSIDCSTVEPAPFRASDDAGLVNCARKDASEIGEHDDITLDGVHVRPVGVLVATEPFAFTMPPQNNFLGLPGRTTGRAAAFGYMTILRPLSRGHHTIVHEVGYIHRYRTTYHLIAR
jgi:hypothetical protein